MTRQHLALMIAPVSPSNGHTVEHNIGVAKDWYPFLREITADLPITIFCPGLVGILLGDQDGDPAQRERALVDSETGAARCDFTIAVGQIVTPSTGMRREIAGCPGPWVDLLDLGMEYETPQRMGRDRREEIRERLRNVLEEIRFRRHSEAENLRPGDVVQITGAAEDGSTDTLACFATVVEESEVPPDAAPNSGGVPVYLHSHADGLWGRIRRDRLKRIGRAAMVASPSTDLSDAPVFATSSVARSVVFKPPAAQALASQLRVLPWPAGPWPTDEEERRGRATWPGDEP